MNLLHDPWMPVRDDAGMRHWIAPDRLAEPQWRAFDADRPDFNGALAQFAIGLLQTTTPVDSPIEWRRCLNSPPSGDTLRQWFAPVTEAFVFDGDGPRFMQDLTLRSDDAKPLPIADLLIDTPSEDRALFVKRRASMKFCAACAASATLTLQINSPEGGRGHFTGIRGGGPLTTLVWGSPEEALWTSLWRNVRFDRARAGGQSAPSDHTVFPWLATIDKLRAHGGEITSAQAHEMHVFWAMPRRVWIEFHNADQPDQCGVCGRSSISLVGSYRTRPYGLKYPSECWAHPLAPYRLKDGVWRPVRPRADGLGYRQWLAWVLTLGQGIEKRAQVVEFALSAGAGRSSSQLRLRCFGYEMRQDNPLGWHESTLPTYNLADCAPDGQRAIGAEVARWLSAAEATAEHLRDALFTAWFRPELFRSSKQKSAVLERLRLLIADFWSATQSDFYRQLQALIEATRQSIELPPLPVREGWHRLLVATALDLFDERLVGTGPIEQQDPRRAALARNQLLRNLHGPKLRAALGLPVDQADAKPKRKAAAARRKENA